MAANMIGYRKRIIIVATGLADMIMINPGSMYSLSKTSAHSMHQGMLFEPSGSKAAPFFVA